MTINYFVEQLLRTPRTFPGEKAKADCHFELLVMKGAVRIEVFGAHNSQKPAKGDSLVKFAKEYSVEGLQQSPDL